MRKKKTEELEEITVEFTQEEVIPEEKAEETVEAEPVEEAPKKTRKKRTTKKEKEQQAEEIHEEENPDELHFDEEFEERKKKSYEGFEKRHDVKDLIARGKAKGKLTSNEIFEIIDETDCDVEAMERIYTIF